MSFTNAPVTRSLVVGLVASSVAASLFDVKHYFYILVDRHVWQYHQLWRMLIFQLCYTNSTEVLFAAMTLYNMRVVERLWGSRKYASFLVMSGALTTILTSGLLVFAVRPLTFGLIDYLPAGPTPLIFAILAQYHGMVPHLYRYRLATGGGREGSAGAGSTSEEDDFRGLTFSDKSYRYALALQLALFQWPGSMLGAGVGWVVGHAWRNDLLPGKLTAWRLPGWMVGQRAQKSRSDEFEGLRRRLQGEENAAGASAAATASGIQGREDGVARRRGMA